VTEAIEKIKNAKDEKIKVKILYCKIIHIKTKMYIMLKLD